MSLAFDEYGRPFVIIKEVRRLPWPRSVRWISSSPRQQPSPCQLILLCVRPRPTPDWPRPTGSRTHPAAARTG